MDFPFARPDDKFADFLDKIKVRGVPDKADRTLLKSCGFGSSYHDTFLTVLRFLGLVDKGVPTDYWKQYRARPEAVLAERVRASYSVVFDHFGGDPISATDADLCKYFTAHTSTDQDTVQRIVRTFRTLCARAALAPGAPDGMAGAEAAAAPPGPRPSLVDTGHPSGAVDGRGAPATVVNLNIQLTLPATEDAAIYDRFFAAMRKHLYPGPGGSGG